MSSIVVSVDPNCNNYASTVIRTYDLPTHYFYTSSQFPSLLLGIMAPSNKS